ncbi:MAG: hypothetical protein SFW65_07555 [Alphaproteobacteria bacterium]|nr:hypothetical protein [Alphaproteobacteria bacterium]
MSSNLRMSVYTLMGLIDKDIPLATVTDKKSGRVFEMAWLSINLPEITLDGRIEPQQNLPAKLIGVLQMPPSSLSDTYRLNAEVIVIREKIDGAVPQSWSFRSARLTRAQQRKLIIASELIDTAKGPIIPRFVVEVGAQQVSKERAIVVRPKGLLFSSKAAAKRKSVGAKAG